VFRLHKPHKMRAPRSSRKNRACLAVEVLETRIVPFALTGSAWPHPNYVTLSFVPDGTQVPGGPSNLFATMNARFGSPGAWEPQILLAAQDWAMQTNLNLFVVPDNGTPMGQGAYEQGAPNIGDIRIGGFNSGTNNSPLAYTFLPPQANNSSIAGDVIFNTGYTWNIGSTYDLFTVGLHELGHSFGLGDQTIDPNASEYTYYTGVKGQDADDIAGIRTIYSSALPRSPDAFGGLNSTWLTSTDLTGYVNPYSNTVLMQNLDVYSLTVPEWFVVRAPSNTVSNPLILTQTLYQSMLFQEVFVYSGGNLIASGNVGNPWNGTILDVALHGITPGQMLYIEVTSATTMPFGVGNYALSINFGSGPTPSVAAPYTTTSIGNPIQSTNSQTELTSVSSQPLAQLAEEIPLLQGVHVGPSVDGARPAVQPIVVAVVSGPNSAATFVAPALPTGSGTVAQPASILIGGDTSNPASLDGPGLPLNGPDQSAAAVSVPAPLAVTAEPEQATRELPGPLNTWAEASTTYFSTHPVNPEDVLGIMPAEPSGMALQAAVALAGFVALAGENRMNVVPKPTAIGRRRGTSCKRPPA
jgi:Matrixin